MFADKNKYPYHLGMHMTELEIVHQDISQGDFQKNNTQVLFAKPLDFINEIEVNQREYQSIIMRNPLIKSLQKSYHYEH